MRYIINTILTLILLAIMKKMLFVMVLMAAVCAAQGQVVFSKFSLSKNGYVPAVKTLDVTVKIDKEVGELKYLKVEWYAVNAVGDCEDGLVSALTNEHCGIFLNGATMVGPIPTGKKRYSHFKPAIIINYDVTAIPVRITMTKMDDTEEVIVIDQENIGQYFPNVKWIDYKEPADEEVVRP